MSVSLRPYQQRAVKAAQKAYDSGEPSQLIPMATGCGKTHTAIYWMREQFHPSDTRVLWLAHSKELITQSRQAALNQDSAFNERIQIGDEMPPTTGIMQAKLDMADARWTFATIQTVSIKERLRRYLSYGVPELIVCDEAHHAAATSYQDHVLRTTLWMTKLNDFDAAWDNAHDLDDKRTVLQLAQDLKAKTHVLGLTATPKRMDGKALGSVFSVFSGKYLLPQAIRDGYLKPLQAMHVATRLPFEDVRRDKRTGSFVMTDLVSMLEVNNWVELVAESWQDKMPDAPQTIVFMPSIDMSRRFVAKMNESGFKAGHIDFQMCIDGAGRSTEEVDLSYSAHRQRIIESFQTGEIKLLSGFGALLEGFDAPATSGVLWARPTLSDIVLTQGVGRGARTASGVARQLLDQKEDTWRIQFDNGEWVGYNNGQVPFNTVCQVIDFVDVEASLMTAGDLGGIVDKPATVEDLENEEETEDLIPEVVLHREMDDLEDSAMAGDGKVYSYKSLFRKSGFDWFVYNGIQSVALDRGLVTVIYPPVRAIAHELLQRVEQRRLHLDTHRDLPVADEANILKEMGDYKAVAEVLNSFSVWRAECPVEEKGDKTISKWESGRAAARLVSLHDNEVTAFESTQPVIDLWTEPDILNAKSKTWHSKEPSPNQLKYIIECGSAVRLKHKHQVLCPTPAEIYTMNRGDVSALYGYVYGVAMVHKALKLLTSHLQLPEDIWFTN
jgi:superfamily II DNA or RNA helicase